MIQCYVFFSESQHFTNQFIADATMNIIKWCISCFREINSSLLRHICAYLTAVSLNWHQLTTFYLFKWFKYTINWSFFCNKELENDNSCRLHSMPAVLLRAYVVFCSCTNITAYEDKGFLAEMCRYYRDSSQSSYKPKNSRGDLTLYVFVLLNPYSCRIYWTWF